MVMEHVRGRTLRELLQDTGPLPPRRVLRDEVLLVLGLSLAASAVYALVDLLSAPLRGVIAPLFADVGLGRPTPVAVADAPPPEAAENARLVDAVKGALPILGGTATAAWGLGTAVGPVLQVRWEPDVTLGDADAVQQAVVAAVGTVVDAMDRAFPSGFRSDQGTPLAAVQVALPDQDPVLVAVRTYRELAAGEATAAQVPSAVCR
jgi:hypothetical protein